MTHEMADFFEATDDEFVEIEIDKESPSLEHLLWLETYLNHQDFNLFKSVQSDFNKVKSVITKATPKVGCMKCPYTTMTVDDIKRHIKSVHKGVHEKGMVQKMTDF